MSRYQGASLEVRHAQASMFERVLACAIISQAVEDYREGPTSRHYASAAAFMFSKTPEWKEHRDDLLGLTCFKDNLFAMVRRDELRPAKKRSFAQQKGLTERIERPRLDGVLPWTPERRAAASVRATAKWAAKRIARLANSS